jgi:hypothetical protein
MPYSKWSNSVWHTFWASLGQSQNFKYPTQQLKNSQVFEIYDYPNFVITYNHIKNNKIDDVLNEIKECYSQPHMTSEFHWNEITGEAEFVEQEHPAKNPTDKEILELKGYIEDFINDVDNYFKWYTFFKYEWWYPIKRKITRIFMI